eukprot:13076092-Alexandrium_andersonii.AAC.1
MLSRDGRVHPVRCSGPASMHVHAPSWPGHVHESTSTTRDRVGGGEWGAWGRGGRGAVHHLGACSTPCSKVTSLAHLR